MAAREHLKAIILAAGVGSRLRDVTGGAIPKCLLAAGGSTLLERQLAALKRAGAREVFVVIGARGECWTDANVSRIRSLHRDALGPEGGEVLANPDNLSTQAPYSLYLGFSALSDGGAAPAGTLLTLDGDLCFDDALIGALVAYEAGNAVVSRIVESRHIYDQGSKLELDDGGRVLRSANGLPTHDLYSGVVKVDPGGQRALAEVLASPECWQRELAYPLELLRKRVALYALRINSGVSVLSERSVAGDSSWAAAPRRVVVQGGTVRKYSAAGRGKLENEAAWIRALPPPLAAHAPRILASDFEADPAWYEMERCEYPNLSASLLAGRLDADRAMGLLEPILELAFDQLYTRGRREVPPGFVRDAYGHKLDQRLRSVAGRVPRFDALVEASTLTVNGRRCIGARALTRTIFSDLPYLAQLEPPFLSSFHGDFKPDNMLVDPTSGDFRLIDPRGKTANGLDASDPVEDLAKLRTSLHSHYDLIVDGRFSLSVGTGSSPEVSLDLGDGRERFTELDVRVLRRLAGFPALEADPGWRRRLLFLEAMLLLANAPFQLLPERPQTEEILLALYLQGTLRLNELFERYPPSAVPRYGLFNINTSSQYEKAQHHLRARQVPGAERPDEGRAEATGA